MANSLPGSPIVGYYKEEAQDFDEHTKELVIKEDKIFLKEKTRPYGFVDLGAKCWFQKFLDDGSVEREYLMTEGYLWTGQYPECQRIIDKGNNQSMELDPKHLDANWTKDSKGKPQFFIINEALISKLCVLGDEKEPCFEGSTITKAEFSFSDNFKEELSAMIFQLQQILNEGGLVPMDENTKVSTEFKEEEEKKKKEQEIQDKEEKEEKAKTEDNTEDSDTSKEKEDEDKKKKSEFKEEVCEKCGKPISECICEEEKKEFSLDSIPEYIELKNQYSELENKYNALVTEHSALTEQVSELSAFKAAAEREQKEEMIKNFYMLSDEDKKDVVENIDSYSLNEIESKLSVICFRNKVNFNLEEEDNKETKTQEPVSYNLNNGDLADENVPAWIRAVRAVQNSNN